MFSKMLCFTFVIQKHKKKELFQDLLIPIPPDIPDIPDPLGTADIPDPPE